MNKPSRPVWQEKLPSPATSREHQEVSLSGNERRCFAEVLLGSKAGCCKADIGAVASPPDDKPSGYVYEASFTRLDHAVITAEPA